MKRYKPYKTPQSNGKSKCKCTVNTNTMADYQTAI